MSQKFANAARSVLMAGISAAATSITLDAAKADLFPVADTNTDPIPTVGKDWFKIAIEDNTGAIEIIYVRSRASGAASLTNCLRGQEGTTARAYLAGSIVELRHTAVDLSDAISFATSATPFWKGMVSWATAALSRTALGITAVGDALFTAADATAARSAISAQVAGAYAAQGTNSDITSLTGLVGAGLLPVGSVIFHTKNTAPTGYLKANGALISRTTYAALFAAIGTTFGVGDGSATFALPDLRGEFLRGWDDGRAIDSGRSFGTAQAANVGAHSHTIPELSASGGLFNSTTAGAGGITYAGRLTQGDPTGETRPRNIALLACIKF